MRISELRQCPACDQDLPARAASCPTCRFDVAALTHIWMTSGQWAQFALRYALTGFVIGFVAALIYPGGPSRAAAAGFALLLAVLAPAIGLAARALIGGRLSHRFVAVGDDGILVGLRTAPLLIPWNEVQRTAERRGVVRIHRRSTDPPVALDDVFRNPLERKEFCDLVRSELRSRRATAE